MNPNIFQQLKISAVSLIPIRCQPDNRGLSIFTPLPGCLTYKVPFGVFGCLQAARDPKSRLNYPFGRNIIAHRWRFCSARFSRPKAKYYRKLILDILRYGYDVEVLSSRDLKQKVKEKLQNAVKKYT